MKYTVHKDDFEIVRDTSGKGCISATYAKLVEAFGEPMEGDQKKVDAIWVIKFEDDTIATIYNYKDGKNYLGEVGREVEEITYWHVGGHDEKVVAMIQDLFETGEKQQVTDQEKEFSLTLHFSTTLTEKELTSNMGENMVKFDQLLFDLGVDGGCQGLSLLR